MKAFPMMWRTLKALYDELFLFVWLSLLWWVGTVLVLPAGPVTSGLHKAANEVANYRRVDSSYFWEAARGEIVKSWILLGFNLLLLGGIGFNIFFYAQNPANWARIVAVIWVWVFVFLLLAGQYFFPLFWQQEEQRLVLVLRNATLLTLRHPLYTFLMLIFQITLLVISVVTVLPIFLLTPAAIAVAANVALVGVLEEMGLAPPPPPGV